jgi:predicted nucleic-acid-binding protein
MLAIDTNVLVRLLVQDDAKQVKTAEQFIAKGAWVSHVVLAEALWVLESVYDRSAQHLMMALTLMLTHESLVLQDADTVSAALVHFKSKPKLGFSDCLVLEIARKAGHVPLGTFDKALSKLNNAQGLF